jgi:3-oxoacyl-(acyl-carrier-protein) synthase
VTIGRALREVFDRSGLTPRDIGRIVSGASGSIAGDRLEADTLRGVWEGNPLPPILAPKGATGQYGGGFLASAVRAVSDQECDATAGFEEPDPRLGVVPHRGGPLPPAAITLVTSLGSGGAASWLLLEAM